MSCFMIRKSLNYLPPLWQKGQYSQLCSKDVCVVLSTPVAFLIEYTNAFEGKLSKPLKILWLSQGSDPWPLEPKVLTTRLARQHWCYHWHQELVQVDGLFLSIVSTPWTQLHTKDLTTILKFAEGTSQAGSVGFFRIQDNKVTSRVFLCE